MRILLLNQAFYPDVVSTSQYLTDLALGLRSSGHDVTVIAAATGYDDPASRFPVRETWHGIRIIRLRSIRLSKTRRWKRAIDFGAFMAHAALRLAVLPRFDVVVALTSPPLISTLAGWFVRAKGGRLVCWVMDLNPDESVAAGWLAQKSMVTRLLNRLLCSSLRTASSVVVLDRFMRDRIAAKGIDDAKIAIIPPWSHDNDVRFDVDGRARLRRELRMTERFVVMYAGNHSPCNPLDTLLDAADVLRTREDVHFCFVGGGSQFAPLQLEANRRGLSNVSFVPYRPRHELGALLSAGDLHVVSLGNPFVGILHPCKIYNVLRVSRPVLYLGPSESHLADISALAGTQMQHVTHGDSEGAVRAILSIKENHLASIQINNLAEGFSMDTVLPRLQDVIEGRGPFRPAAFQPD